MFALHGSLYKYSKKMYKYSCIPEYPKKDGRCPSLAIVVIRGKLGLLAALLFEVVIMRKSHTHQNQTNKHGDLGQGGKKQDGGNHAIEAEDEADASDDGVESAVH